jgi:large subunit ribosomal protein L29
MKAQEVRALTTDVILAKLNDAKEEQMKLRFQQAMGNLTDSSRLRHVRRMVARLYTILNERQQATEGDQ